MAAVYSLGSINLDVQVRVDEDVPRSGLVTARDLAWLPGGKAANVAVLVARLGGESILLGAVGDDEMGHVALEGPRAEGVDVGFVRQVPAPTGAASVLVRADGDKAIVLAAGANDAWGDDASGDEARHVADAIGWAPRGSVVVLDLEVPGEVVGAAIESARDTGCSVVVDPSPPGRLDHAVIAAADHLTPDHHEAGALTGLEVRSEDDARRAAERLVARGATVAHVKLQSGGCVTDDGRRVVAVRAPMADAVDTTGAGDAFAGGLAHALLGGADVPEAARCAVAASTCAVGAYGSQDSYPTRPELDDVLRRVRVVPLS